MPTVTPPAISVLPAPPDPNNRATFNTLAYPWSVAQGVFSTQLVAVATNVKANADDAAASAAAAATIAGGAAAAQAAVIAQSPVTNAAAASASAAQAAIYAAQAQATNPDSPIRINPRTIIANFTVGIAYNAQSTGPITISEGVTVTVSDNATYVIQ